MMHQYDPELRTRTMLEGMHGHPLGCTWRDADPAAQSCGLCVDVLNLFVCRRRTCHADSPLHRSFKQGLSCAMFTTRTSTAPPRRHSPWPRFKHQGFIHACLRRGTPVCSRCFVLR